jgi:hypothetical protein
MRKQLAISTFVELLNQDDKRIYFFHNLKNEFKLNCSTSIASPL